MAEQIIREYTNRHPKSTPKCKYAYVTFIIMNDSFLPGALMFAYGLKKQHCTEDIVCLISGNVTKSAKHSLHTMFDKVINVDEVYISHKMRKGRQDRPFLFSRFNALRLGDDGDLGEHYKKIILCDADLLPMKNYSSLFSLNSPAGIINESKQNCMSYDSEGKYIVEDFSDSTWCWHSIYKDCPHGERIPAEITDRVKADCKNMGVNASLWVLEPSYSEYSMIMEDVEAEETKNVINTFRWPEMQYATIRWSGQWTNIDLKYSSFNGYPSLSAVNGLHYAGTKPWKYKTQKHLKFLFKYPDYYYWYMLFLEMMHVNSALFASDKLSRMYGDISEVMKTLY